MIRPLSDEEIEIVRRDSLVMTNGETVRDLIANIDALREREGEVWDECAKIAEDYMARANLAADHYAYDCFRSVANAIHKASAKK